MFYEQIRPTCPGGFRVAPFAQASLQTVPARCYRASSSSAAARAAPQYLQCRKRKTDSWEFQSFPTLKTLKTFKTFKRSLARTRYSGLEWKETFENESTQQNQYTSPAKSSVCSQTVSAGEPKPRRYLPRTSPLVYCKAVALSCQRWPCPEPVLINWSGFSEHRRKHPRQRKQRGRRSDEPAQGHPPQSVAQVLKQLPCRLRVLRDRPFQTQTHTFKTKTSCSLSWQILKLPRPEPVLANLQLNN
jgi:hypothetical protein